MHRPGPIRIAPGLPIAVLVVLLVGCSSSALTGLPEPLPGATPSLPPRVIATISAPQSPTIAPQPEEALPIPGTPATGPLQPVDTVLVGAGDIASCGSDNDEKTARLLDQIEGTVFTLGDNVYNDGTTSEFRECYEPTWGRHKGRTRPASGNHDYNTKDASGYFRYFSDAAGDPEKGYYSYDVGAWHVVVLNSNCGSIGGCGPGSEQARWLREDLKDHPAQCTLSYWHHPLFNSGKHESSEQMRPLWSALYEAGADVVLSGHDHNYQRYAPQDASGALDPQHGIRQFVVGTGGKGLYDLKDSAPNLEASNDSTYGVLKLTLSSNSYAWEFIPIEGQTFTDSGEGVCH